MGGTPWLDGSTGGTDRKLERSFRQLSAVAQWRHQDGERWGLNHPENIGVSCSENGDTPSSLDGVYFRENPSKRWMIWGCPSFRKPPDKWCPKQQNWDVFNQEWGDVVENDRFLPMSPHRISLLFSFCFFLAIRWSNHGIGDFHGDFINPLFSVTHPILFGFIKGES